MILSESRVETRLQNSSFFHIRLFNFQTLTNLFSSKPKTTEVTQPAYVQPQPAYAQPQTAYAQPQPAAYTTTVTQPGVAPRAAVLQPQAAAPVAAAPAPAAPAAPAAPVVVDLDAIPGLDDFEPVAAPAAAARPRPGAAGLKPGQKPAEEGGLLGGLTSGITGLASGGVGGVTGKLTGGAGAAAGAAGDAMKKLGLPKFW